MSRLIVPANTWVLVCDGSKAIFYRNVGDALAIELQAEHTLEEHRPPTHELGTERPGRAYASVGRSRSAVAGTDLHEDAEADFLKRIGARLDDLVAANPIGSVIIAAPPRALGILRHHLGARSRKVLQGELAKDLVKMPKPEVEKYLQAGGELR
jgi:protein required for attachment to host cells